MSSEILSLVEVTDVSKAPRPFEASVTMSTETVSTTGKIDI